MRTLTALVAALACTTLLAGCASSLEPRLQPKPVAGFDLVDPAKVDAAAYEADYAACAALANQDRMDAGRVVSGALGAAAERATFGIVGGKQSKDADRNAVLKRCLEGRGYRVLR